jgi:hypothetical protein
LKSGSSALATASLNNGTATLSASGLGVGPHSFIASYSGDSLHEPANSAPLTVKGGGLSCVGSNPPTVTVRTPPVN